MKDIEKIKQLARAIPKAERQLALTGIPEVAFHRHLKELFGKMEPSYLVEITHGNTECGKDLVIVQKDRFGVNVFGVVVKCGDLKGKTAGDIDDIKVKAKKLFSYAEERALREIESQIEQAKANAAELKTVFERLPVTKVMVVVNGEISNQARTRIGAEFKSTTNEIKGVDWLVDAFSDHYPQVFFEGRVIDFTQSKIQQLENTHFISSKKGLNLSECFVEPCVTPVNPPKQIEGKNLDNFLNQAKLPLMQFKKLIGSNKKVILIGDPGTGKSAALAKLAIEMFNQAASKIYATKTSKAVEVPIIVHSREILAATSAKELLSNYYADPELAGRFTPNSIMVDGLDEVAAEERMAVIEKSKRFSDAFSVPLVITSRNIDIVEKEIPEFIRYELMHFEFGQALKFFEKITKDQAIIRNLKDGLARINGKIPLIPLSLMFLIQLVEDNKEIPASVTELYDRYYDMALGRYDKEKGMAVLFEYFVKKKFLAALAYKEFLKKNRLEIPQKDYERFLADYAREYEWGKPSLVQFAQEIARTGVLSLRGEVFFKHRSILDYFSGFYLYEMRAEIKELDSHLLKLFFSSLWSDVVFFYIGLRREISKNFVCKILAYGGENKHPLPKLLSGRLLQAGWNSKATIRLHGVKAISRMTYPTRNEFIASVSKDMPDFPAIVADFIVLKMSDVAFGSSFLTEDVRKVLKEIKATPEGVYQAMGLLMSQERFLKEKERLASLATIADMSKEFSPREQASLLIFSMYLQRDDKAIVKALRRQVDKLITQNPGLKEKLLPEPKKGFRKGR